jgi:hypothetical protein
MPYFFVEPQTYRRIDQFARISGINVVAAIQGALNEWMDTTGDLVVEFATQQPSGMATPESKARPVRRGLSLAYSSPTVEVACPTHLPHCLDLESGEPHHDVLHLPHDRVA